MLEIPEATTIARQGREVLLGKQIDRVIAAHTPHKFAWYHGDPQDYPDLLKGKTIINSEAHGGMVVFTADDAQILLGDGTIIKWLSAREPRPGKHQLLMEFTDGSALCAWVQMYGGLWCFPAGEFDNPYYQAAQEKPSPLSDVFDPAYFQGLLSPPPVQKLSLKAFLATQQRIPGLGNGVLQDILWRAKMHPKTKVSALTDREQETLFHTVKSTLASMTALGGRDTEKDLFGASGGYRTAMSKNNRTCPECGEGITRENYMGGSIYFCSRCQPR